MRLYDWFIVRLGNFVHAEPVDYMAMIIGAALAIVCVGVCL